MSSCGSPDLSPRPFPSPYAPFSYPARGKFEVIPSSWRRTLSPHTVRFPHPTEAGCYPETQCTAVMSLWKQWQDDGPWDGAWSGPSQKVQWQRGELHFTWIHSQPSDHHGMAGKLLSWLWGTMQVPHHDRLVPRAAEELVWFGKTGYLLKKKKLWRAPLTGL